MANLPRKAWILPIALCLVIGALWIFPKIWYSQAPTQKSMWFAERTSVPGWDYTSVPIAESAERILVADRTVNGEFKRGNEAVRVFSAKRYVEKSNEVGLFVHTPDRCWVESGWKIEPTAPDVVEMTVHGVRLLVERRIFEFRGARELVYFAGLVGGQPLPYRLDHNLSVGMRTAFKDSAVSGTAARASDAHFWQRLWKSFASRSELLGPKHFIRISTPIRGGDAAAADKVLQDFVAHWLAPGDFEKERAELNTVAARS